MIAGFLHLFHDCTKQRIKKIRRPSDVDSEESQGPRISQAYVLYLYYNKKGLRVCYKINFIANIYHDRNTIQNSGEEDKCSEVQAEFIGFTVDGGPIVRFAQPVPEMPQGKLLGSDQQGGSTFAFPKGIVRFEADRNDS